MNSFFNLFFVFILYFAPLVLLATDNQDLVDLKSAITTDATFIVDIIDQIMIVVMIGGIIYVAGTLISEKSVNSSIVAAWFVALIIWIVAKLILGIQTN